MALTRAPRSFSRGSLRVTLARFVLVVLCALPAWLIVRGAISGGPATNPYFVDGEGPLPWVLVVRMVMEVGAGWAGGLAAGAMAAVILDQLLLAGAVRLLSPPRGPWDRPRLAPAVFRGGLAHLWPLLRVTLLALLVGGLGAAALRRLSRWLHEAGVRAGWWSYTIDVAIPLVVFAAILAWLALVAAAALWTRVIVVADGRRRARRAAAVALGVFHRRPGRALAGPAVALLVAALVPAPVLAWWRASEPLGGAGVAWFTCLALAALAFQAWIWTRLIASAVALYATPQMDGLRAVPDAPFRVFRWFRKEGRAAGEARSAP
jgi:hypothetical protein